MEQRRARRWLEAVKWHAANHKDTAHVFQDLRQANWAKVPRTDIGIVSPCCPGHADARGKSGNPEHDASRSTAWAVPSAAGVLKQDVWVAENVPEFVRWVLYPSWLDAMQHLGYQVAPHIVDCADLGVLRHRVRLFLIRTKSKAPIQLQLQQCEQLPRLRRRALVTNREARAGPGHTRPVHHALLRQGLRHHRPRHQPANRHHPTLDRWGLVDGDRMRMLSVSEALAAMSFPADTLHPDSPVKGERVRKTDVGPAQAMDRC